MLPKKYNRKESKIDREKVGKWFMDNYPHNFTLEVKVGKNKALEHQIIALKKVHEGKFLYKIPDMGRRLPFDLIGIKVPDSVHAFVVTCNGNVCVAERKGVDERFEFTI